MLSGALLPTIILYYNKERKLKRGRGRQREKEGKIRKFENKEIVIEF